MTFSLPYLFLIITLYLLLLFGVTFAAERGLLPRRLVQSPLTQMLSLGIYASVWTFYSTFALVGSSGSLFLASYLGASAAFMLAPMLFIPIFNITSRYQLSSLADLFAFRFRSRLTGAVTTVLLLLAMLPLLSIQIETIADFIHYLHPGLPTIQIGAAFCILIALFSVLFGARHPSMRARNHGLVLAMAAGSLIKLLALLAIALYLLFSVLGGPLDAWQWLQANPLHTALLTQTQSSEQWRTLLLAFFSATLVMPHMFHLAFTENHTSDSLHKATWGMPLYLFLMALSVPVIVLAALKMGIDNSTHFLLFDISQLLQVPGISAIAFIGGLAAASGILIVAAISLAAMLQNHLILPLVKAPENVRFYVWLLWLRRGLILLVVLLSYLFYLILGNSQPNQLLGLSTFIIFLQFLPGIIATLFWLEANKKGMISGLVGGVSFWLMATFQDFFGTGSLLANMGINQIDWESSAISALLINVSLLVAVSKLTYTRPEEISAGESCLINTMDSPKNLQRPSYEIQDIRHLLAPRLGEKAAERELRQALQQLNLSAEQTSALDLLRLRSVLEQNLSALVGPLEAARLLEPLAQPTKSSQLFQTNDIHLLESHLETYQARLSGLAVELDILRRYHRTTLEKLPIGACTVATDQQILLWNQQISNLTGIAADQAARLSIAQLPPPWNQLFSKFLHQQDSHQRDLEVELEHTTYWLTLHKSPLSRDPNSDIVLLVEDETERHQITHKLIHNERLASIGRFAAGVAHEIGNPVTGIACLAQNLPLETDNPEVLLTGQQIIEQTQRINRIVQSLIRFAHTGQTISDINFSPIPLQPCLEEAIQLVSLDSHSRGQAFNLDISQPLDVFGDRQLLLQVFINLLNNACDASPRGARIAIHASRSGTQIRIQIIDEGEGIDPAIQNRLFEPFFTTKEPGKGTGLGLAMVYNILTEHYGTIELLSPANKKQKKGTQVNITLPGSRPSVS